MPPPSYPAFSSLFWDGLYKKILLFCLPSSICSIVQILSISLVSKKLFPLILEFKVFFDIPIRNASSLCVNPALAISPKNSFLLSNFSTSISFYFWDTLNITPSRNPVNPFVGRFTRFLIFCIVFLGRICYIELGWR